jgi:hypothetical protein
MKMRLHKAVVVLVCALLCFSSLSVAAPLVDEQEASEKDLSLIDSHSLGWSHPWGWKGTSRKSSIGICGCMMVCLSTRRAEINWGETAALKWSCVNARTCTLMPDVGALAPYGFGIVNVSPKETTRYTLTGTKLGCSAKATVTITVINIPPEISIIEPAQGSELTLGATDSVPVQIQYSDNVGIDAASFNARLNNQEITDRFNVTDTGASASLSMRLPAGDNTLTVTIGDVEGLSRTATTQFTVTYLPPTVSFSAEPPTCRFGESTTLAWQSANADSVSIEPGIGAVGLNDSLPVTLYENSTYTITATGPGGTVSESITIDVTDIPPPGIYYKYDSLGRITRIMRLPASQSP